MTYTPQDFDFNNAAPVISSAQKFIVPIPNLRGQGEPLTIPQGHNAGEEIKDWQGNAIGDDGVVFYNAKDQAWQAVQGDGTGVVIMNQVTQEQAAQLHDKIDSLLKPDTQDGTSQAFNTKSVQELSLSEIKDVLSFASEELGIGDMYNSDTGFIAKKMSPIGDAPSDEAFGLHKRDDRDICQAVYIAGEGEFQGPAATPQKFENGAVIVKQGDDVRLIQPDVFEQTYRHTDGSSLSLAELPLQGNAPDDRQQGGPSGIRLGI